MLSKDRLVVASFARCNNEYEKSLLPVFDKRIEITNDVDNVQNIADESVQSNFQKKRRIQICSAQKRDINVDASEMNRSSARDRNPYVVTDLQEPMTEHLLRRKNRKADFILDP